MSVFAMAHILTTGHETLGHVSRNRVSQVNL